MAGLGDADPAAQHLPGWRQPSISPCPLGAGVAGISSSRQQLSNPAVRQGVDFGRRESCGMMRHADFNQL